ncbi:hypothetical protein H2203_005844 [Taxawa tesnikishii (nom. ined.)]|nr:hypothetical protein H2203_005844 [Dothideales sp. JES 119]
MAEDFAELGIEGVNKIVDKWFEHGYDAVHRRRHKMASGYRDTRPPADGYDSDYSDYDERDGSWRRGRARATATIQTMRPSTMRDRKTTRRCASHLRRGGSNYNDRLPPPSSRQQAAPYIAAGSSGGQLAPYREERYSRSANHDRSRSRRRRSRSSSRSRSRSRSRNGDFGDLRSAFDTGKGGIGAGIAGALVGGLVGRELGNDRRHNTRDAVIGALVGGLGANLLENRYKVYKEDKREEVRREEKAWENKWDNGRRPRSR